MGFKKAYRRLLYGVFLFFLEINKRLQHPTLCKYVEVEKDEKYTLDNSDIPKPNNK